MTQFIIKGEFPARAIPEDVFKDENFAKDALAILSVPDDVFQHIEQDIAGRVFVGPRGLRELIRVRLTDAAAATSLTNAFVNFAGMRRSSASDSDEFAEFVEKGVREAFKDRDPSLVEKLATRLRRIATPSQAMLRQEKAQALSQATGWLLREFALFTDIRPVFDEDRKSIEGAIPVITATFVIDDPDGLSSRKVLSIDEEVLNEIIETAETAKRKLIAIRELLAAQDTPMPEARGGDE